MGRSSFAISLMVCLALGSLGSAAFAQDAQVVRRISKYGKLSSGQAKRLAKDVSKQMKRAADMTGQQHALRGAVSQALFNTPAPADQMAAAKVRLRLYAGLNDWALDNLFKPRPGAIASCIQATGGGKKECEALVAASGKLALAEARKLGAGAAFAARPAPRAQPQRFGQQPQRFGQQPQRFGQQPQRFGQRSAAAAAPAPRPMTRPVARTAPVPMGQQKTAAQRKAEYQARRQAYLDRKKAEMAARKAKIVGNAGGDRAVRGPANEDEAAAAGLPAPKASEPDSAAPVAAAEPSAPKQAEKKPEAALDEGFLGDLLGDPLGNK